MSSLHRIFHWFTACWHYGETIYVETNCKINPTEGRNGKLCCVCGVVTEHEPFCGY